MLLGIRRASTDQTPAGSARPLGTQAALPQEGCSQVRDVGAPEPMLGESRNRVSEQQLDPVSRVRPAD
eukprot:5743534-Alexandrium_andersonii.AAC.1